MATTRYPNAWNRKRKVLKDEVHRATKEHDWIVRRPFWVCRSCDMKVDGSLAGNRVILFSECPCADEEHVVSS